MDDSTGKSFAAALRPTAFLDSASPQVAALVERVAPSGSGSAKERAIRLYYAVRDEIRYDPYALDLRPEAFTASACLKAGTGFCITKSVVLGAAARAIGVPAKLGFADVRNHLATPRLLELMGTDVFYFHGYTSLYLDGQWVKATAAFNLSLCERFGVLPLDFDGSGDSVFHPFDTEGRKHMEYLHDRGLYDDLPFEEIVACFRRSYPRLLKGPGGDFHAEAAAGGA